MHLNTKQTKSFNQLVELNGNSLTLEDVIDVARHKAKVSLSEEAMEKTADSRRYIEELLDTKKTVYGVNTGFGKFSEVKISKEDILKLQENLIASHAVAVGEPFDEEVVRAIMLLRANALAKGYSGVRPEIIQLLIDMLNNEVHPVIPCQGSLGASGDLAPLSHMVLVMTGKGEAYYRDERMDGLSAMRKAGLKPWSLLEKEGLALINGTQVMTAVAVFAVYDALNLSRVSDIVAALTMEALEARKEPFDEKVYNARPHPGHLSTINNIKKLLEGSKNIDGEKVQDAYSIRCVPQVHGSTKETLAHIKQIVDIEINSATDNPLVFAGADEVISAGNFHGQPIAQAMDYLCVGLSELGNISERRLERLLNASLNGGYPPFLAQNGGVNSGLMIVQYTAASLVSENKGLSAPSSVDSIPVSASQEDHVSMGTTAARKAYSITKNITYILAAEYIAAVQALDMKDNCCLGKGTSAAFSYLRSFIDPLTQDRVLYKDVEKVARSIHEESLVNNICEIFKVEAFPGDE